MKKQIVLITWVDSATASGWHYGEVDNELQAIHSIGFILKMDKKAVTISSTVSQGGRGTLDPLTIPYGAILKVTKIKLSDKQFAS
jgi:hypothetical protein